jgi:hypothetical protein
MPAPPPQDSMLDLPPFDAPNAVPLVGLMTLVALAVGLGLVYASRPRNLSDPKDLGNFALRNAGAGFVVFGLFGLVVLGLLLASSAS